MPAMDDLILIAGCGYLGRRVAARLASAGHAVVGVSRQAAAPLPGVTMLGADLASAGDLARLPPGISHVLYAVSTGGRARTETEYRTGFLDPLAALTAHGLDCWPHWRRTVLISSTGVYGQADGAWVDETSETRPLRPAGRVMLEAEALVSARTPGPVTLRLAGIYGPGRQRLITAARRGETPGPEEDRWLNQIHADDAARLAAELLTDAAPPPRVVGVDRAPARRSEVLAWLRDRLGVASDPTVTSGPGRDRADKRCRSRVADAPWYRLEYPTFREGYGALLEGEGA